jgi:hypothetical protein
MSMDYQGVNPTSETGELFCNNNSAWFDLPDYLDAVAPPDLMGKCKYWGSNDGDGLDAADSRTLADLLQQEIDYGRTAAYATEREGMVVRTHLEPLKVSHDDWENMDRTASGRRSAAVSVLGRERADRKLPARLRRL